MRYVPDLYQAFIRSLYLTWTSTKCDHTLEIREITLDLTTRMPASNKNRSIFL